MPRRSANAVVHVLAEDRDLGGDLDLAELAIATARARAVAIVVERGEWREIAWPQRVRQGVGLLVLEGLLCRHVEVDGHTAAELLGRGDLLRPWQPEDAVATHAGRSGWRVLAPARLAILDVRFAQRIAAYPQIQGRLLERSTARSRHLAFALAVVNQPLVQARVRMMLWHMAVRWGSPRAGGVLVPKVTQQVLGELVAARRPTISGALGRLERDGEVSRTPEGWLLHERRARAR